MSKVHSPNHHASTGWKKKFLWLDYERLIFQVLSCSFKCQVVLSSAKLFFQVSSCSFKCQVVLSSAKLFFQGFVALALWRAAMISCTMFWRTNTFLNQSMFHYAISDLRAFHATDNSQIPVTRKVNLMLHLCPTKDHSRWVILPDPCYANPSLGSSYGCRLPSESLGL